MFRPIFGHHQGKRSYTTLGITVGLTFVSYVSQTIIFRTSLRFKFTLGSAANMGERT